MCLKFKGKSMSFYESCLLHILFDLMRLLYCWCLCILEIYCPLLWINTVCLIPGALEHCWVAVMTYADWNPSSCRQMIYKSGFVFFLGLDWRYWFLTLQFRGLEFLQKQRSLVWNVFSDMVLIKVEEKHTPWETTFPIWKLLRGSWLLETRLWSLSKHLTLMSSSARCAALVLCLKLSKCFQNLYVVN